MKTSEMLAKRQMEYIQFAARYAPVFPPLGSSSTGKKRKKPTLGNRLFWSHDLTPRSGIRVHLAGLNTALVAADDLDKTRLRMGKAQLARTLPNDITNTFTLVLTHHPLAGQWLADETETSRWLAAKCHVISSGHVHEAESEQWRSGGGSTALRIVAGAAHTDPSPDGVPTGHGYSVCSLVRLPNGRSQVRVWPRRWSDKAKDFRLDIENVPRGKTFAEHPLAHLTFPRAAPNP